jgi:hypothetical protein
MKALAEHIAELDRAEIYGRVVGVRGLMIEAAGPLQAMPIGARVHGFDTAVVAIDGLIAADMGILEAVGLLFGGKELDIHAQPDCL